MQIFINFLASPTNENLSLTFNPSDTIGMVKSKIESERRIPKNHQRLTFTGDILNDETPLASCNIQNKSILYLLLRFRDDLRINVKSTNGGCTTLDLQTHTLVEDIKLRLKGKEGFPSIPEKLPLFFAGTELEEGKNLSFYRIEDGSTLFLDSIIRKRKQITIKTDSTSIRLDFDPNKNVHCIKSEIERIEGIPISLQCLKFDEKDLEDLEILESHGIREEAILHLDLGFPKTQVLIETLSEGIITLQVENSETIRDIKTKIREKTKIPLDKMCLIHNKKELENTRTINDFNFGKYSPIHLVLSEIGPMQICVRVPGAKSILLNVEPFDTVEVLMERVQFETRIPSNSYYLIYAGKLLEKKRSLSDYKIQKEATICLGFRPNGKQVVKKISSI